MAKLGAFQRSYWFELWELDDLGNRVLKNDDFSDWFSNHNVIDYNIQKSITSNQDTASITIQNHRLIEEMYKDKYFFFKRFHEKDYEVDLMHWHQCQDAEADDGGTHVHCMFSGDLENLYPAGSDSITDQALSFDMVAGKRTAIRSITNKSYPAGTPYRVIVQDLFGTFVGYNLSVLDDPFNKLAKTLLKPRTFHGKTETLLNSIATDLEMTWGFDASPWLLSDRRIDGAGTSNFNIPLKNAYWVDKKSVFDVAARNGIGPRILNGSTNKQGRIGYSKDQITVTHGSDPMLNIGILIQVSDYGTMNEANDFTARVNRMSINNETTTLEASYYVDGQVILEEDKRNAGSFVL